MALRKVKGNNFRIFAGTATFALETSCSVNIQGNMEDGSTKDSAGAWQVQDMTEKQWNVQVEQKDAELNNLRYLLGIFVNNTPTTIGWDESSASDPTQMLGAEFARSGVAILNDLVIQANDREDSVVTTQWQGYGALA